MSTDLTPHEPLSGPAVGISGQGDAPIPGQPIAPWKRYAVAVWRARWILVALSVVGSGIGYAATRTMKLSYRAQSTLWVEISDPRQAAQGPIRTEELLESYGWIELLESFTVLDHAVRELNLYVRASRPRDAPLFRSLTLAEQYRPGHYRLVVDSATAAYVLATADGREIERSSLGGPVGRTIGLVWSPPAAQLRGRGVVEFEVANVRDRASELREALDPQMTEQSNFLSVFLTGEDPAQTMETLRSITHRYVEVAAQLKRAKLDELSGVLGEQLRYAEDNLRTAETELEAFRVNTITLPAGQASPVAPGLESTRDPVMTAYFELKIDREQLRSDREAIERVLTQMRDSTLSVDALAAVPSVQNSLPLTRALQESTEKRAELRGLEQRYTDDFGRVQRLRAEITQLDGVTIPRLAAELRRQLQTQESISDGRIGSASRELQQIPPRAIEEARLQRRVEIANNLHGTLRQRYEEARLATASSIPDIRILDEASVSSVPLADRRPLAFIAALLGTLGLGIAVVLAREVTDPRVRYPEQITHGIGLPILGAIPHVDASDASEESIANVLEAFRETRLAIAHAHGATGPTILTITSPESGAGKSFVVANLGAAFARRGDRTLVIDADTRRGTLHHLLDAQRSPGLTDYLASDATLDEVLQPARRPRLWLISSGTRMRSAPELIGSARFALLLASMSKQFDAILVDSPPLGAGADPYLLATVTRNVLLVLRTGTSDRAFAEAKLEAMTRLPVRILGALLNDFTPSRLYRYYSYLPGYAARSEDPAATPAAALVIAGQEEC